MTKSTLKLLIIGGYGNFGGRLVRLLRNESELTLFVGGRSLHKAKRFVADLQGDASLVPVQFDRNGDLTRQLVDIAPDYVIDASGPWQNYGDDNYRVPRAAIAAGINYLDLADSTEFVCGIGSLNDSARRQGIVVMSGLSTCPALTAAVVRRLENGFASVASVTGGIAPSPIAGMGMSVISAIATYAGKPVKVLKEGLDAELHTLVSTRKYVISPPGIAPLPPIVYSLVDLPDLKLLAGEAGRPKNVWFGVGTRPGIYHALLRLLARGVKAGFYASIRLMAGAMHFVANHLSWGEHRSGMFVELVGESDDGNALSRSWHLVADGDTGLNVPVLAVMATIRSHLNGKPPKAGARPANQDLELTDFEPMFDDLGIVTGTRSAPVPESWPLFRTILGDTWLKLPEAIRAVHGDQGQTSFAGAASVARGKSFLSRLIGKVIGMPGTAKSIPVTVTIEPSNGNEEWTRNFSGHGFASEYSAGAGRFDRLICERFGPVKIGMALTWDGDRLNFLPRRWSFLGIPMPGFLTPSGEIYETVVDGNFQFHVEIALPVAGHVVTYAGRLRAVD